MSFIRRFLPTLFRIAKRISEIPVKGLPHLDRRTADDFDKKYGVETAKLVRFAATDSANARHGKRYEASSEASIRWSIENCGMDLTEAAFVDIGCGKGRPLIIAAMYPFKRILGIEYAPELAEICRKNIQDRGLDHRCEVIVCDAAEYEFPKANVLAYFYNPFDEIVHRQVLENLAKTKGAVRIAHRGPGHDIIRSTGLFYETASGPEAVRLYAMHPNHLAK